MAEEFLITVDQSVDVIARDGKTVVGHVEAGTTHRAVDSDEFWFTIALPDGTTGYVPRSQATMAAGPPPEPAAPLAEQEEAPIAEPPAAPIETAPVAAAAASDDGGWSRVALIALVVVLIAAAVVAGWFFFLRDDALVLAEGEVFLEPADDPGPEPFTAEIAVPDAPEIAIAAPALDTVTTTTGAAATAALPTVSGAEPGLYGGTQDVTTCDPDQMVAFLAANPDKAQAWIQGINADPDFRWSGGTRLSESDIPVFMAELTSVTLIADTRVTNNGYRDGAPTPRQAVLQAGTSVLVDTYGVPRAKCNCGNPLAAPVAQTGAVAFTGSKWDTFMPESTVVVQPSPAPLPVIEIADVSTGELIERPVGTSGEADTPTGVMVSEAPADTTTTTSSTTTQAPTTTTQPPATTTTVAAEHKAVTAEGTVSASSVFSADFPATLSVDSDPTTSWFSSGPESGSGASLYRWEGAQDDVITVIEIISNASHSVPEFRTGFGFESVLVQVLDASSNVVFEQTVVLAGTPDPDVVVHPGVVGRSVVLSFFGHEDPTCGGFGELRVTATR